MPITETGILLMMVEQRYKALRALAGYKFWMFGYYAAAWVNLRKLLDAPKPENPFRYLVCAARFMMSDEFPVMDADLWQQDPEYPLSDWQHEVSNNETRQGYWEWVNHQKGIAKEEVDLCECGHAPHLCKIADGGDDHGDR